MRFPDWLDTQPRGTATRLSRETGVALGTIWNARNFGFVHTTRIARILSDATGGTVTVEELCRPVPANDNGVKA